MTWTRAAAILLALDLATITVVTIHAIRAWQHDNRKL